MRWKMKPLGNGEWVGLVYGWIVYQVNGSSLDACGRIHM